MVIIVFVIGALNFGLGFGLAILLERPVNIPFLRLPRRLRWRRAVKPKPQSSVASNELTATLPTPQEVPPTTDPPRAVRNDFPWLPQEWAELLTAKQVAVQSFPEALFWVAHSKLTEFCDQLQQYDQQAQSETTEFPLDELLAFCGACRTQLTGWKSAIGECKEPGSHGDQLVHFIQWIQEAAQQLEQVEQVYEQAAVNAGQGVDRATCRQQLLQVFTQLRALGDRSDGSLARLVSVEKRFGSLPEALRIDAESTALNRLGLETTIHEWIEKDPDRVRMASAMLVDIDQCTQLNDRYGLTLTNKLLSASLSLLVEVVRKDRGFDRVAQFSGQSFLVFLGDTALRNAIVGAERVRQNIGAAVFKSKLGNIPITTSCSVTEWNPTETFDELICRLRLGMAEAKKGGRNCTVACGPDDMRVAQSSRMQVTAREIALRN